MTCGRDAADKGGGNRQDGCGQGFRWNDAPPYRRGGLVSETLGPKGLADVDARILKEIRHHVVGFGVGSFEFNVDDLPGGAPGGGGDGNGNALQRQSSEEYRLKCHVCRQDIVGPRFVCLHCPGELDMCVNCSDPAVAVAKLTPDERTVAALVSAGCSEGGAAAAVQWTRNEGGVGAAMEHYFEHEDDYQFLFTREDAERARALNTSHAADHVFQIFFEDQAALSARGRGSSGGGGGGGAAAASGGIGGGEGDGYEDWQERRRRQQEQQAAQAAAVDAPPSPDPFEPQAPAWWKQVKNIFKKPAAPRHLGDID
jgi:hypothetical protein